MKSQLIALIMMLFLFNTSVISEESSNPLDRQLRVLATDNLCESYCNEVMGEPGVCKVENQDNYAEKIIIYPDVASCMDACSGFPSDGEEGAVSGNNVQCRTEHAILAQGIEGPEKHCPHAAPGGGGVCIDRSPCEAYCLFYSDRVEENECPAVAQWGGVEHIGVIDRSDYVFQPNPLCMNACAEFAGAGQAWEMSGDSANCRQQYYLMAHRRIDKSVEHTLERKNLCSNAHPYESEMCQGYSMGEYYTTTEPNACKELCYNDKLTCESEYGTTEQCLSTCETLPVGQRRADSGNSAQCRLTWMQNAFFVDDQETQTMLCDFGSLKSPICTDSDSDQQAARALIKDPDWLHKIKMSH